MDETTAAESSSPSRRTILGGAAVLGAGAVLAACGGSGESVVSGGTSTTGRSASSSGAGTDVGKTSSVPVGGGIYSDEAKAFISQPTAGTYKAFNAICTHKQCPMPTLLVPQLRDALLATDAQRVLVLNLVEQVGETEGLSPVDHLEVLNAHAPDLRIDLVVADESLRDPNGALAAVSRQLGARLVTAEVAVSPGSDQHDPVLLSDVLRGCLRSPVK